VTRLATLLLAAGASLAACSSSPNCETCASLGNACVPPGACTPSSCERSIVTSALPAAQVQSLGVHKVGTEIAFTVPTGAGSVTILQQAKIAGLTVVYKNQVIDNSAVPLTVTFPDGRIAYDDNVDAGNPSPDGGEDSSGSYAHYGGVTPNTAAFTIPNTAASLDGGVPAGTWKFVVNDYAYECTLVSGCNDGGTAASEYDISVITRTLPAGSVLDVAFYIVADVNTRSGAPLRAANAPNDPNVKRMVQTVQSIMADAGIAMNAQFYDVSDAARTRFGTNLDVTSTGPCEEMNQMFTLSSANRGNLMNLFLVQGLRETDSSGSGGMVVGVDGTGLVQRHRPERRGGLDRRSLLGSGQLPDRRIRHRRLRSRRGGVHLRARDRPFPRVVPHHRKGGRGLRSADRHAQMPLHVVRGAGVEVRHLWHERSDAPGRSVRLCPDLRWRRQPHVLVPRARSVRRNSHVAAIASDAPEPARAPVRRTP